MHPVKHVVVAVATPVLTQTKPMWRIAGDRGRSSFGHRSRRSASPFLTLPTHMNKKTWQFLNAVLHDDTGYCRVLASQSNVVLQ